MRRMLAFRVTIGDKQTGFFGNFLSTHLLEFPCSSLLSFERILKGFFLRKDGARCRVRTESLSLSQAGQSGLPGQNTGQSPELIELAEVVKAWPSLSAPLRSAVLAIVRTAQA